MYRPFLSALLLSLFTLPLLHSLPTSAAESAAVSAAEPFSARAQLLARRTATLSAGMAGRVERFPVRPGQRVERGATLVRFDCRAERASRAVAASRLDAASIRQQVNQRLAELQNVSTLDLELSRAEEAIARADLKRIDAELGQCTVRAPFDGEVVETFVRAEHYLKIGEPLLRLVDSGDLEIEMVLPSSLLRWLEVGQPLEMVVDELAATLPAKIERIVGEVEPVSQTVRVVALPDAGGVVGRLLPGMSGRITLFGQQE